MSTIIPKHMAKSEASSSHIQSLCEKVLKNINQVIIGKEDVVRLFLAAILCDGHVLLEDVPGVGKTMLARSMAISLGLTFRRIQFTPDLLPTDVTGVSVYNQKTGDFEFRPGPIMAQVVLADEINRATPRTQAGLLECMEERQITVEGKSMPLPNPFLVIATQNPIEYEGTFPLPEAQLDRFMFRISIGYPDIPQEVEILERQRLGHPIRTLASVSTPEELSAAQEEVREIFIEDSCKEYIVKIVHGTRNHRDVALGASPRGSLALARGAQALAAMNGREYVIPDDIKQLVIPVLAHRIVLKPESALRGTSSSSVLREIVNNTEVQLSRTKA